MYNIFLDDNNKSIVKANTRKDTYWYMGEGNVSSVFSNHHLTVLWEEEENLCLVTMQFKYLETVSHTYRRRETCHPLPEEVEEPLEVSRVLNNAGRTAISCYFFIYALLLF